MGLGTFGLVRVASFCIAVFALRDNEAVAPASAAEVSDLPSHRSLLATTSLYGTLEVTESDGIRYLFVDDVLQTAMYPDPNRAAKQCHLFSKRYRLELLPYFHPQGKRCLLIGLGGGLLPAVLAGYGVETHSVEIDPKVLEVARKYFRYRQRATVCDGRNHLERVSQRYDFIVIDAFAGAEFPYALASEDCFQVVEKRLESSGVLAVNLISRPTGSRVSASVVQTLRAVFPHVVVYRSDSPERIQALACFASKNPLKLTLHPHGGELGVTARRLADLARLKVAPSSPKSVVLTDGHNPLDREWSKEAGQWRRRMVELFGRRKASKKGARGHERVLQILCDDGICSAADNNLAILRGDF